MRFVIFFFLLPSMSLWAAGINDDSPLQKICQNYLLAQKPYTMKDIRTFTGRATLFKREDDVSGAKGLSIYSHPFLEPLYFLESPDFKRLEPQETADAIEYAEYLKTQSRGLVFIPSFMGLSVPDFDGVVFDLITGKPLFNISLKHANTVFRTMTAREFGTSLAVWARGDKTRFSHSREAWFRAVNNADPKSLRREDAVVGVNSFTRFKVLALAFGLFDPEGFDRHSVVVRDLSDRGISFDTARGPEFRSVIEQSVREVQTNSLTAIWDRNHVWEFPLPVSK
ncbi:MAG: hypothetical protein KF865_11655 [Bdellovibrionaceae bacterium]|nr:hypothetical protein [Pseudobdellovibrionaceae bacterium]